MENAKDPRIRTVSKNSICRRRELTETRNRCQRQYKISGKIFNCNKLSVSIQNTKNIIIKTNTILRTMNKQKAQRLIFIVWLIRQIDKSI